MQFVACLLLAALATGCASSAALTDRPAGTCGERRVEYAWLRSAFPDIAAGQVTRVRAGRSNMSLLGDSDGGGRYVVAPLTVLQGAPPRRPQVFTYRWFWSDTARRSGDQVPRVGERYLVASGRNGVSAFPAACVDGLPS